MTYQLLAGSCDNGPCPNFWIDDATGDVLVQGYLTSDTPPDPLPAGEGVLRIDAAAWKKLVAQKL